MSPRFSTRYDGWIYAALSWLVATVVIVGKRRWQSPVTGAWVLFTVMVAMAPVLWIVYNARQFHDPFDFLRGPYSAKAIEIRTTPPGAAHYPGWHNMRISSTYFLKTAQLNAAWPWAGRVLVLIAVLGSVVALRARSAWITILFWMPYPFYAYSVAYGSVPIFIPMWDPHSFYNTRYGLELVPAFALFTGFALAGLMRRLPAYHQWLPPLAAVLIGGNSAALLHAKPLVLQEAIANGHARIAFEHALAMKLADLPPNDRILMYTSAHVGALQQAGIPLRQTINEGDYYQWNAALAHPAAAAPWIIADGWRSARNRNQGASRRHGPAERDLFYGPGVCAHLSFPHCFWWCSLISFVKAHACGNDFLIVEQSHVPAMHQADIARRLCARTTGVGADGVEYFEWLGEREGRISLRNADGSVAEISGNGTRCVAAWMAQKKKRAGRSRAAHRYRCRTARVPHCDGWPKRISDCQRHGRALGRKGISDVG